LLASIELVALARPMRKPWLCIGTIGVRLDTNLATNPVFLPRLAPGRSSLDGPEAHSDTRTVAQAFQPAGSGDFPVASSPVRARRRRYTGLESLVNPQSVLSAVSPVGNLLAWRDARAPFCHLPSGICHCVFFRKFSSSSSSSSSIPLFRFQAPSLLVAALRPARSHPFRC
jgi:hypothetical protein